MIDDLKREIIQKKIRSKTTEKKEIHCKKCNDKGVLFTEDSKGYRFARDCICRRVKRWNTKNKNNGMSLRLKANTFNSFMANNSNLIDAKNKAMNYARDWKGKSLLICGSVGSGKTHLGLAVVNAIAESEINGNSFYQVLPEIVFYTNLIGKLKSSMSFSSQLDTDKIMNKFKNERLLMIDDFLKLEKSNVAITWLFEIINYRYINGLPTIITTEYTPKELINIDEALGSRLVEMAGKENTIIINSKNMRI